MNMVLLFKINILSCYQMVMLYIKYKSCANFLPLHCQAVGA